MDGYACKHTHRQTKMHTHTHTNCTPIHTQTHMYVHTPLPTHVHKHMYVLPPQKIYICIKAHLCTHLSIHNLTFPLEFPVIMNCPRRSKEATTLPSDCIVREYNSVTIQYTLTMNLHTQHMKISIYTPCVWNIHKVWCAVCFKITYTLMGQFSTKNQLDILAIKLLTQFLYKLQNID